MQTKPSWQQSAVALFATMTARLTEEAREFGEALGWNKALHVDAWRTQAHWLNPVPPASVNKDG